MIFHLLSHTALACVCGSGFGVLPLGERDGPTPIPPNGVFRLYASDADDAARWGVYDTDGELVPTTSEQFDEYGGNTLVELRATELLADGIYVLRTESAPEGREYEVAGPVDDEPPVVTRAWFEGAQHSKHTSCGESMRTNLGVEPPPTDPTLMVRIVDPKNGLYWHRAGLAWNDTCGGYPPEAWSGRKEISLVDWAGNESEPAGDRVCGACASTTGASAWPLALLVGLLSLRHGAGRRGTRT